ncbi:CRACD-like protein isoform X1 [Dipodomys merriami]|uniref:CRACD-like protein isoform X1 n=2 Tax=Dipodomys merriami TaxID=94247 RepID=UPI003856092D
MREPEAHCTFRKMAAFYQCVRPDPSELDMISTRVTDIKLRDAAESLGEDGTGKKKSKFKTFKKLFGKKKRKESPSSTGSSTWKQNQAKSEVMAIESGPVGYDSEDELEESRGTLGSRALSHDSIFIPEAGQDPARPVRVFSQENVCDRIKALQLKIQCNVRMGPPPPGGIPAKRAEDTGMSSEDDGLPRSPPEMSLLHDVGPSTTIKISLVPSSRPQSPDHTNDATVSSRTSDNSLAPVADFSCPPEFSSCLDNSAAKHKLLVKPRNRKMRRLSSRAQSESLSDLICTPEEEEYNEKLFYQVSMEENISFGHQESMLDREPEPGVPVNLFPPGGPRARRARLQHCPALSASMEEATCPGDEPSSRPATPEVTEPVAGPGPSLEAPSESEGNPHPSPHIEIQEEEPSTTSSRPLEDPAEEVVSASGEVEGPLSTCASPETVTVTLETPPDTDGAAHSVQEEEEALTLEVPGPEGAGDEPSPVPVPAPAPAPGPDPAPAPVPGPSPTAPKSCLKHKAAAAAVDQGPGGRPTSPAEALPEEPSARAQDAEAAPAEPPKAKQAETPHSGPERAAPQGRKSEPRGAKKFSVSSCRARLRPGSARPPERPGSGPAGGRAPPLRSAAWRSEAALDDLPLLVPEPQPQPGNSEPLKPAECDSQDPGEPRAPQAGPGSSLQDAGATPGSGEPSARDDRSPFPVKLRSTSLSLKYREGSSSQEAKGIKRYSAEVRMERGGLTLLPKDEQCHTGSAPALRGARSPNSQGKGKARSPEQPSSKPPLPRKPLLQSLTLPYPPAGLDASPGEPEKVIPQRDPRRESRMAEKKSPHRGAEKGLPPAITGSTVDGQPNPPWITMARQKRRGAPDQPPHQEDKPGVQITKPETGKQAKPPEKAQEPVKQADFVRSKSFLMTPAKPAVTQRQGAKLSLKEGLQRGISLSHQNLAAQAAAMTEKELHQLKRASYASADQPSWMELARKKSQAWSDMPQIIK